jgi:hypothetical protein
MFCQYVPLSAGARLIARPPHVALLASSSNSCQPTLTAGADSAEFVTADAASLDFLDSRSRIKSPPRAVFHDRFNDVGKERHRREALVEPGLGRRILKIAALERWIRGHPLVERSDLGRLGGAEQHLREKRIGIEGDGRE